MALGCKSDSCAYWVEKSWGWDVLYGKQRLPGLLFCFFLEDFVANTEQAKENAQTAWGKTYLKGDEDIVVYDLRARWDACRHAMIDAPDPWKFLEERMRKE